MATEVAIYTDKQSNPQFMQITALASIILQLHVVSNFLFLRF